MTGPLDLGPAIADHENIVMQSPDKLGGWFFHKLADGIYECHSQFLPEGRGPKVKDLAGETLDWIFANTPAKIILARCPQNNTPVIKLTQAMGFRFVGAWGAWPIDGADVLTDRYQLSKEDWLRRRSKHKSL